jgi:DNA-binding MarR family transcriptional regulator
VSVGRLSTDLHKLTARLDRAADQVLSQAGTSYARFLALLGVAEGARTQRELSVWLGITEPSVSRTVRVLVEQGLVHNDSVPRQGNRRQLSLTTKGKSLVERSGKLLEQRFAEAVRASGVPYEEYGTYTKRLLDQLAVEGFRSPLDSPRQ